MDYSIDEDYVVFVDKMGRVNKYHILFSFDSLNLQRKCIVYTDYSLDSDGNINIYYGSYDENIKQKNLEPITTDLELKYICKVLKNIH